MLDLNTIRRRMRAAGRSIHVGLTGGIASGKSTIADMFLDCGAHLIDFDLLAREVVAPGTAGLTHVVAVFGKGVLSPDGALDRKTLSAIVFNDSEKRKKLEAILHPAIFELFCQKVDGVMHNAGTLHAPASIEALDIIETSDIIESSKTINIAKSLEAVVIVSVIPLLIEMTLQPLFDGIVVVHVSEKMQLTRLMHRDGIDETTAKKIMASQLPIDEKRQYADFLVDNSHDLTESRRQVNEIWGQFVTVLGNQS